MWIITVTFGNETLLRNPYLTEKQATIVFLSLKSKFKAEHSPLSQEILLLDIPLLGKLAYRLKNETI